MIQAYVHDIAAQMRMKISQFSMVKGCNVGCLDVHLLNFTTNDQKHCALVYQSEMDLIQNGECCERLEFRIRSSLAHLQKMQDPCRHSETEAQ
jgi:hypothetical protein